MDRADAIKTLVGAEVMVLNRNGDLFSKAYDMAIAALREQEQRERNEPLTLDELLHGEREPVFIVSLERNEGFWVLRDKGAWADAKYPEPATYFWFGWCKHADYGKTWLAYRHKLGGAEE